MDIKIQSVHFKASDTLEQEIVKKLQKHFGHYPYIHDVLVFMKIEENEPEKKYIMEIEMRVTRDEFFAKTAEINFEKALDENIEKLKRQLEKYKEKVYSNP
ncbi:MAG: HPF/RaiA family ribosome-associated protein [Bacteroidetes bacterium]|nr:MAG: HPF/RaiA family ribosome-associated protein [Bacteroidota bacterium]